MPGTGRGISSLGCLVRSTKVHWQSVSETVPIPGLAALAVVVNDPRLARSNLVRHCGQRRIHLLHSA